MDLNDNVPEFEVDLYNISIIENLPKGFSILQVNAIDRDQVSTRLFRHLVVWITVSFFFCRVRMPSSTTTWWTRIHPVRS